MAADTDTTIRALLEQNLKRNIYKKETLKIVQEMLDTVSEDFLLRSCQILCQGDYEDVTIERSIAKLCGYPVCNNELTTIPRQRFHISIKNKRVYDITERKRYCSGLCFRASKYLCAQLPTELGWNEDGSQIHLLPSTENCGSPGEVVELRSRISLQDVDEPTPSNEELQNLSEHLGDLNLNITERCFDSQRENIKRVSDFKKRGKPQATGKNEIKSIESEDKSNLKADYNETSEQDFNDLKEEEPHESQENVSPNQNDETEKPQTPKTSAEKNVERVCCVLHQWVTIETMQFVTGSGSTLTTVVNDFVSFLDDVQDKDESLPETSEKSKTLVTEKYRAKTDDTTVQAKNNSKKKRVLKNNRVLPTVERLSQITIRRKIVHGKFQEVFADILPPIGLVFSSSTSEILKLLVDTFNLAPTNIIFKPAEQILLATALILMLSRKDEELKEKLQMNSSQKYLNVLLSGFDITLQQFDKMVSDLLKDNVLIIQ